MAEWSNTTDWINDFVRNYRGQSIGLLTFDAQPRNVHLDQLTNEFILILRLVKYFYLCHLSKLISFLKNNIYSEFRNFLMNYKKVQSLYYMHLIIDVCYYNNNIFLSLKLKNLKRTTFKQFGGLCVFKMYRCKSNLFLVV